MITLSNKNLFSCIFFSFFFFFFFFAVWNFDYPTKNKLKMRKSEERTMLIYSTFFFFLSSFISCIRILPREYHMKFRIGRMKCYRYPRWNLFDELLVAFSPFFPVCGFHLWPHIFSRERAHHWRSGLNVAYVSE